MFYFLLSISLLSSCLVAQQSAESVVIQGDKLFAPHDLNVMAVIHNKDGFHIQKNDNTITPIKKCWTEAPMRNISPSLLTKFLESGYLDIKQLDNKDFVLRAKTRGNGGGLIAGYIAYGVTKVGLYGLLGATAGTVITTGTAGAVTIVGNALGASAPTITVLANAGAAAVGETLAATGGVGMAANAAAAGTAALGGTELAVTASGVMAQTGLITQVMAIPAAIETAAVTAQALATMCWFLP